MPTVIPGGWGLPIIPPPTVLFGSIGGGAAATNTTPMTWTHNVAADDKALVMWASVGFNTSLTKSCTVGGVAMTDVSPAVYSTTSGSYQILCFRLLNPPTGSQTVSLTVTSGTGLYVRANTFSYKRVGSFGTVATGTGSSTALSLTVPSTLTTDMVSMCFAGSATSLAFSGFTGGTQRYYSPFVSGTSYAILAGDSLGLGGSMGFATTGSPTSDWGAAGLRLSV